jgi:hypothetical protein
MSIGQPDVTLRISAWFSNKENNGAATGTLQQGCCWDPHTLGLPVASLPRRGVGLHPRNSFSSWIFYKPQILGSWYSMGQESSVISLGPPPQSGPQTGELGCTYFMLPLSS